MILALAGCASKVQPLGDANAATPGEAKLTASEQIAFRTVKEAYDVADKLEQQAWDAAADDMVTALKLWNRSRAIAEWILRREPNHFDAVYLLAYAYDREGRVAGKTDLNRLRDLHTQASALYMRAWKIQPRSVAPLNTCGLMWDHAARLTAPHNLSDARKLWQLSEETFARALQINPFSHPAANNLGNTRSAMASAVLGESFDEAQRWWDEAILAYQLALTIKPDKVNAATNWGMILMERGDAYEARDLPRARALWQESREKLLKACAMDATYADAPSSLGRCFLQEANSIADQDFAAARALWVEARRYLQVALELNPRDSISAELYNSTLVDECKRLPKSNEEAALALWDEAIRTGEAILQKSADNPIYLVLLADALSGKAMASAARDPAAAQTLWRTADGYFAQSYRTKPSAYAALQWGRSLAERAKSPASHERAAAVDWWQQADEKFEWGAQLSTDGYHVFSAWGDSLLAHAETEPGPSTEAIPLLHQACAKYQKAHELRQSSGYPLLQHGRALYEEAYRLREVDARRAIEICHQCGEKYHEALRILPNNADLPYYCALAIEIEAECSGASGSKHIAALFDREAELLRECLRLRPSDANAGRKLALTLCSVGALCASSAPQLAYSLWDESDGLMQSAIRKAPRDEKILLDWSRMLRRRAEAKIDGIADRVVLLDRAVALCQKAAALEAPTADVYSAWAWSEFEKADLTYRTDKPGAVKGWQKAIDLGQRAMQPEADNIRAVSVCGLALMRLFATSDAPADPAYLQRAETVLLSVRPAVQGQVAYNLACTYALGQRAADCVKWLERADEANELPSREKVWEDNYLFRVRTSPEFQAWSEKRFPANRSSEEKSGANRAEPKT